MDDFLISVIVPVYNVEQYLPKCIDSILNQTYSNLELLLVDDGSLDKSGTICDEYALKDKRVRVFHTANCGLCVARNLGMFHANGNFISFVDGDDWIEINAYEELIKYQSKTNDEIVFFDCLLVYNKMQTLYTLQYSVDKEYFLRKYLNSFLTTVWQCLIKKELIERNDIKFNEEIGILEDIIYMTELIIKASKIGYVNKAFYYYNRDNSSSITHYYDEKRFKEIFQIMSELKQILKDNNLFNLYSNEYNWRVLQSKTVMIIDKDYYHLFNDYSPESNKYIWSCPFLNKKIKLMMWLQSVHLGFVTHAIIGMRKLFNR